MQPLGPRAGPPTALYVHIPFCLSICPYCDFVVYAGRAAHGPGSQTDALVAALHAELDLRADALDDTFGRERPPLTSVYLGGGTPSLLAPRQVGDLLDHATSRMGLEPAAEVTLEANPGRADRGDLAGFRAAGVTRLSFGVQSLDADELRRLGRRHVPADVSDAVSEARRAGFRDVNLDLLYDIPGQSLQTWDMTMLRAIDLAPDHVAAYALTLDDPDDEGLTGPLGDHLPLRRGAHRWRDEARREQDEDRAAALYELAVDRLEGAGLAAYELSNWARPGHESRHNRAYWQREPYEALGPGAHAFDGGTERRWNAAHLPGYLAALIPADGGTPVPPPGGSERVDDATARAEAVILGLRLASGIDATTPADAGIEAALAWAVGTGLVERDADRLRLTARGRLLSNEVFVRILPAPQRVAA